MNGVTNSTWERIRARHKANDEANGTPCALCGTPIDYHAHHHNPAAYQLDHIIPLSRGGAKYEPHNLQPVNRYCNRLKSDKTTAANGVPNPKKGHATGMQIY